MMMVPRSFARTTPVQRRQSTLTEKESLPSPSPPVSALSQSSNPVKIPTRSASRTLNHTHTHRPTPAPIQPLPNGPNVVQVRKDSVKDILISTTIPVRRKPRPRPAQRLPNCDYVADFSKLLREDVQTNADGAISASWSNPHFEGLFGAIDGLLDSQMIVGSEGLDAGILSTRSLSTESMPSLASPDDFSSSDMTNGSPHTLRSPSDHRLRQMTSSEDCSSEHPLLPKDEDDDMIEANTPELVVSPLAKSRRKPLLQEKKHNSFKSSLTASLKALKSAAQTVSNIASTSPLVQSDEFLASSVFDFKPELTDDRRPPPSDSPPSAAMRRYLNPRSIVPPDSPAQLHFWLDEKPTPGSLTTVDDKPKLRIKKKLLPQASGVTKAKSVKNRSSHLPSMVPLSTCIPSTVRTEHASRPPTWLDPDGTISNKSRAAQTLTEGGVGDPMKLDGQPRHREPRDNRDFLRIYVCETNMRRSGKLADEAVGHAKLWLPPIVESKVDKKGIKLERKTGLDRWAVMSIDDL